MLPTPPPSQHWQTPHPAKRVAELRLTSSLEPGEAQLLQGTLILKDSTTQDGPEVGETEGGRIGKRRYIVRAVVSEDNHRLAIFAAPQGLKHLILKDFLYEDRIFHAYIDASYHIAQYFGATLALIGAESYAMPENISRKSSLPSDSIEKDPCLFFGDLKVSGGEEGFGVDGVLISLTCNMSVNVSVGQGVVVGETVWMQNYLLGAGVVTGVQGWGFVRQGVHTPSAVAHARLAWLSFFNLGVLEWAMFGSHFSLLTPMPALLRCVLGIGMLHGLILKLCTQHVMNALLANSFFSDLFSRCWVLAANVAWWAVVYRVPYLWIPAMFLLHSIWLPQIYHSACVNASKPVAPYVRDFFFFWGWHNEIKLSQKKMCRLLLVTTFAARLYYVGAELLHDSFLNTFTPCPGVFVALCVWLLLQTYASFFSIYKMTVCLLTVSLSATPTTLRGYNHLQSVSTLRLPDALCTYQLHFSLQIRLQPQHRHSATMLLQHRYGPTFFLPDTWVPPRLASHDYHKLPPQTDDTAAEEAGTSPFHALGGDARRRGGTDATDEEAAAEVECVICQVCVRIELCCDKRTDSHFFPSLMVAKQKP